MKKIVLFFCLFLYTTGTIEAQEFTDSILGLKYRVLSVENMTCSLIGTISKDISGELIIPSIVSFEGHDLSVVYLANGCLDFCKGITSVTIPSTVETLGFGCFQGCDAIESVNLSENLKIIGGSCFSGCKSLKSISIPPSLIELDYDAFWYCESLKQVIIEDAGTDYRRVFIESENFTNTLFLYVEELYLGRQIAFRCLSSGSGWGIDAPQLKTLILGKNVDSWTTESYKNFFVFDLLDSLEKLECRALVPPSLPKPTDYQYMNLKVCVPEESLDLYKKTDVWKSFWNLEGYSSVNELSIECKDDKINVYSLQGMKINISHKDELTMLSPGFYIINGKKTYIK